MKVLLVDDKVHLLEPLMLMLQDRGISVWAVSDGAQAIEACAQNGPFDYVVSDYQIGTGLPSEETQNGVHLLLKISEASSETRTILFTEWSVGPKETNWSISAYIPKQRGGTQELLEWIDADSDRKNANL